MTTFTIKAQFVDVWNKRFYPAAITIGQGKIISIEKVPEAPDEYIMPGFIDAHVHIESSMVVPTAFAPAAVVHGTVGTVSDPHEIANVCGMEGVQYMIDNSRQTNFKFFFGAPSCVPATFFETAGAHLDAKDIEQLLANPDIWYLAEMMNFPGVLNSDEEVMAKIAAAKKSGKPIDGHAPGLKGKEAKKYASAGITTDHECFTIEEALDKIKAGMKIIIREGSAARNFDELVPLFKDYADKLMFCSDDKHPDELVVSHINALVKRALEAKCDLFDVLRAASVNPVVHYGLPVGLLREGDPADFIVVDNLRDFNIQKTYINGNPVARDGKSLLKEVKVKPINNFKVKHKQPADFVIKATADNPEIRVIEALDGQLVTNEIIATGKTEHGNIISDTANDILKIAVVNRYDNKAKVSVGFIKNIGIKQGAFASTVGHDCHNIIAVGVTDDAICKAVNALVDCEGGIVVVNAKNKTDVLPLPIAGLMSDMSANKTAAAYSKIDKKVKALGSELRAPFMTLSFMALLVIPALKLSDKGLFNGADFRFVPLEQ